MVFFKHYKGVLKVRLAFFKVVYRHAIYKSFSGTMMFDEKTKLESNYDFVQTVS